MQQDLVLADIAEVEQVDVRVLAREHGLLEVSRDALGRDRANRCGLVDHRGMTTRPECGDREREDQAA